MYASAESSNVAVSSTAELNVMVLVEVSSAVAVSDTKTLCTPIDDAASLALAVSA